MGVSNDRAMPPLPTCSRRHDPSGVEVLEIVQRDTTVAGLLVHDRSRCLAVLRQGLTGDEVIAVLNTLLGNVPLRLTA